VKLYDLHTAFVLAFLAFAAVFALMHRKDRP
jgi:hypothetical protein